MIFSRYLQQLQYDKSICDFTNLQVLVDNLLWFKGNGKFQLQISKNKYLIFFSFTLMDPEAFKT